MQVSVFVSQLVCSPPLCVGCASPPLGCVCVNLSCGVCTAEREAIKDTTAVMSCNDGDLLLARLFFAFTPSRDGANCAFTEILVCRGYKSLIEGQTVDWSSPALSNCLGVQEETVPEDFQHQRGDTSDLYRYLSVYVQCWTWVTMALNLLFAYTKFSTKFDSVLYQPQARGSCFLIRVVAYITPFSS